MGNGTRVVGAWLSGLAATIVSEADSEVVLQAPASNGSLAGDVHLEADTGALSVASGSWAFIEPGAILDVGLESGQVGTRVRMRGINLLGGGSSLANVTLAGVAANNTHVMVRAGDGTPGQGDIVLTADTGAVIVLVDGFTFTTKGVISHVAPALGQLGTLVTINGTGLRGSGNSVVRVLLGGIPVTSIEHENDTMVVVRSGASATATGPQNVVLVADTGATVTALGAWQYIEPSRIDAVSPASGQSGTVVVIQGAHLLGGGERIARVLFGSTLATDVVYANDTEVLVRAPDGLDDEVVDLTVESDTGAFVTEVFAFEYLLPGMFSSVTPQQGRTGATLRICGDHLLGGGSSVSEVMIGGQPATIVGQT